MTKEEKDSAKSYLERCDKAWSELHDDMEYRWWQNGVYDHELCCVRNVMELKARAAPKITQTLYNSHPNTFVVEP